MEEVEAESIELVIGSLIDGYAVEVPVEVNYEIDGVRYHFILNGSQNWVYRPEPADEKDIVNWDVVFDEAFELLRDENNVKVFFEEWVEGGSTIFFLDVKGVYGTVTVHNADDLQTAVDGIMSFYFKPLL